VRDPRAIRRLGQTEFQGYPSITDVALATGAAAMTTRSAVSELQLLPLQCSLQTATAVWDFAATRQPDGVTLQARVTGPLQRVRLLRAEATDPAHGNVVCERLGVEPGVLAFTDAAARPEAAYAYALEWWSYDAVYGRTPALWLPAASLPLGIRVASGNPSRGPVRLALSLPTAAPAAVDVFDVAGRFVRQVFRGSGAEAREMVWDGRDARGNLVRSGVYIVRVSAGGRHANATLVRVAPH